jgi:Predicted exporter
MSRQARFENAVRWKFLAVGVWLLCTLASAWLALTKTPVANDLTLFMPSATTPAERLLLNQLRQGPAARMILIAVEGGTEQDRAATSRALVHLLRETKLFIRVLNGERLFEGNEHERLFRYRYLLNADPDRHRFSEDKLREALGLRLRALASPLSPLEKHLLPADPTGEFRKLLEAWQGGREPGKQSGVWFSPDGRRALLLAETHSPGWDLEAQARSVEIIQESFRAVQPNPELTLLLSGPAVFAVSAQETIRAELQTLSLAASAAVALLLLVAYRSLRLLLLGALPLLSSIAVAVATVGLLFGGIHGITLAFGMTLLGVASDYPIHVFSHLHSGERVDESLRRIWPTLRLGVTTTVLAYFALVTTDFTGLVQLGVFASVGLLTAAVFTRWVLPALLPLTWIPRYDPGQVGWFTSLLRPSRPATALVLTVGMAILALAAALVVAPTVWEEDLAALSPIPPQVQALDSELRAQLGAAEVSYVALITAADAEGALQRSESLAERLDTFVDRALLQSYDMAARYLPSLRSQRERQAHLPTRTQLEENLARALSALPFKDGLFAPFLAAVEATRELKPLQADDLEGTGLDLRVASLLYPYDEGWVAIVPLSGVRDPDLLANWFQALGDPHVYYFDLKKTTNALVSRFRDEALSRVAGGALLITLVLWVGLGSLRRVLVVLVPVFLALLIDGAVLLILGERLSIFHLVSLLLVLGLGIDYSLFFNRSDEEIGMRKRTLHAVLLCAASTVAVFAILGLSNLPVLGAIGKTVAIGDIMSFLMALVLAQQIPVGSPQPPHNPG